MVLDPTDGNDPPWISVAANEDDGGSNMEMFKKFGFFLQNLEKIMKIPGVVKMMKGEGDKEVDRIDLVEMEEVEEEEDAREGDEKHGLMAARFPVARVPAVVKADGVKEGGEAAKVTAGAEELSMAAARASCTTMKEGEYVFGLGLSDHNILTGPGMGLDGKANLDVVSYANAVNKDNGLHQHFVDPVNLYPGPTKRGNSLIINIPDDVVDRCIARAANDLIGRFQYQQKDKPWNLVDSKSKLTSLWGISDNWIFAPIGRGYYYCRFNSKEDKDKAWNRGIINLKPVIFKLQRWVPNFNPYTQKNTHANVWVRIVGLSGEMFNPEIFMRVAKGIGFPISIDRASASFQLAHYARVLVEVDLEQDLPSGIIVNFKGVEKDLDFTYENVPFFCNHCKTIGHDMTECRLLRKIVGAAPLKNNNNNKNNNNDFVEDGYPTIRGRMSSVKQIYIPKQNKKQEDKKDDENVSRNEGNEENADVIDGNISENNNMHAISPKCIDRLGVENIKLHNKFGCLGDNEEIDSKFEKEDDSGKKEEGGKEVSNGENIFGNTGNDDVHKNMNEEIEEDDEDNEEEFYMTAKNGTELIIKTDMTYGEILANLRKFFLDSEAGKNTKHIIKRLKKGANESWRSSPNFHELWMALEAVYISEDSPSPSINSSTEDTGWQYVNSKNNRKTV